MGKRSGLRREVVGFVRRYELVTTFGKAAASDQLGEARMGGGCVRVPLLEGRVEAQQPGLASSLVGLAGSLRRIAGTVGRRLVDAVVGASPNRVGDTEP